MFLVSSIPIEQQFYVISQKKIKIDENYRDTVKFCYSAFNGNIKVRLHELHKGKYVHTIANFNKIETLVEEITNNEN